MTARVVSVRPDDSVQVAIGRMMEEHVGSVVVCEQSSLVGIFTERDVLRLASEGTSFGEVRVGDVMTRSPLTVSPDVGIGDAARLMGERRVRHLPVVEGDMVVGMLGIRDVMRMLVERVWRDHDEAAHETAGALLQRGG
ncbi:MAG TPA: CBS domain-containing protein [Gaiellaceae bacterium]|nr:CBS domain-containing protein [Gaiellaceae bacterium]